MSKCSYCHLENTIIFDDNIGYVCSECGTLLDESLNQLSLIDTELPYKENNDFGFYVKTDENLVTSLVGSVGSDSKTYYIRRKKKELYEIIDRILDQLNLLQYRQHSRDWFNRCISHPEIKRKGLSQKGQIIAACAVIITLRTFKIPFNFKEISEIVHTDMKHLGQFFLEVIRCMNIQPKENNNTTELFLPKLIDIFIKKVIPNTYLTNIDVEKQKKSFHKEALTLTQLCKDLGLQEGRNRIPLATAIVRIVIEGYMKRSLNEQELNHTVNILEQSLNTIEKRYKEIANILIECAKCIGVFSQVRLKTLPKYYTAIMGYSEDFEYYLKQSTLYTQISKANSEESSSSSNSSIYLKNDLSSNNNVMDYSNKQKMNVSTSNQIDTMRENSLYENNIDKKNDHENNKNDNNDIDNDKNKDDEDKQSNETSYQGVIDDFEKEKNNKLPSLASLIIQMPPASAKEYLRQLKRKKKLEQVKLMAVKLKENLMAKMVQTHQTIPVESYYLYYIIEFVIFLKEIQQKLKLILLNKIKNEKIKQANLMHITKEEDQKRGKNDNNYDNSSSSRNTNIILNNTIKEGEANSKSLLSTEATKSKSILAESSKKRKIEAVQDAEESSPNKKFHQNNNKSSNMSIIKNKINYFTIPILQLDNEKEEKDSTANKNNDDNKKKGKVSDDKETGIYIILKSPQSLLYIVERMNWSLYNILILYLSGMFSDQEIAEMSLKKQQIILGKLKEIIINHLKEYMKSPEVLPKLKDTQLLTKLTIFRTHDHPHSILQISKRFITSENEPWRNEEGGEELDDEDLISDEELNSYIVKKGSKEVLQRQQLLSYNFY